jgi:hypothetical protein
VTGRALVSGAFAGSVLVLLGACSSSAPKNLTFGPQSLRSVLAFGLAPAAPVLSLHLDRLDPATCRVTGTDRRYEKTPFPFKPNARSFVVDDLEPGFYAITSTYDGAGMVRFEHTFENGADAFEVKRGRINYIGDIALKSYSAEFTGYDEAALSEYLKGFPGISGEPMRVATFKTAFSYKKGGPRIAGCTLPALAPSQGMTE